MNRLAKAQAGIGAALILLGATVMAGWVLGHAAMVQILPNFVGMVFNSALCFALIGAALLLPSLSVRWTRAGQTAIGWTVVGLSLIVLTEILVDGNLGLDFPSLHAWLNDSNSRPGRMAFNTCIGLLFCGLALAFMQRVRRKAHAVLILIATFAVFAFALTGIAAYPLDLGLLYSQFYSSRMPLLTAAGLMLAGTGLWLSWGSADWYRSRLHFKEDEKVGFIGGAMLSVVALTAGIAGFSAQQHVLEKTLSDNLVALLKSRTALFQSIVRHIGEENEALATKADVVRLMQALRADPDDETALAQLHQIGKSFFGPEISGIAMVDASNREIAEFGQFAESPQVAASVQESGTATLLWNDTLYLNTRTRIVDGGETIGFLLVEQSMSIFLEQMAKTDRVGHTGRVAMCAARPDHLLCFPGSRNGNAYRIPLRNPQGHLLPVNYAVKGQSGVFVGEDHQGRNVIAAYGPIGASGLGIVVKQDTQELYRPVRERLELTLPLLLLFVAASACLLHLHVKPLAGRLLLSERDANEKELRTRTVVDNVGEGIITLNEDGVIESFNNAASVIFGYTQAEAVGQHIRFLMPAEMRESHDAGMRRYVQGGASRILGGGNIELPGLHKTGATFQLELMVNVIRIGEQRLFVGIVRDITQRRKAENDLRSAHAELEIRVQERTAELLKANELLKLEIAERKRVEDTLRYTRDILTMAQAIAHLGNWEMDVKTGHTEWSDEFFRICGLEPRSEKPSLALGLAFIHRDDRQAAKEAFTAIVAGNSGCKYEWRIVRPDGAIKYVLAQGEVIYNECREAVTLVGTFLDITEHKLAETALRESKDKLRKIAAHQDRIKEEERKRIAREIHDELGGLLTGIKSYLSFSVENAERAGMEADRHLVDACGLADSAIETARRVITDLRPSVLDQLGLWAALEWYAGQFEERTGLACVVTIDAKTAAAQVDSERSTALFRIVQEALTNVVRHAKASRVAIRATCKDGEISIRLEDDGNGIEPQSLLNRESWGIVGMYERARYFGGELNIATGAAGQGTVVDLRMPMENADEH